MSGVVKLVSLGIGVLLAVSGSIAALAANTDSWETHRVAAANFDRALVDARYARAEAIDQRMALIGSMSRGEKAATNAERLVAGVGPLDVSAIAGLVAALRKSVPDFVPSGVDALDGTPGSDPAAMNAAAGVLYRWSENTLVATAALARRQAALDGAIEALADGIRSIARTVPVASNAALMGAPLTSAAQKNGMREATDAVTEALRAAADPLEPLLAWAGYAVSLRDAQLAAATSASNGSSATARPSGSGSIGSFPGFPGFPDYPGPTVVVNDPFVSPRYSFDGARVQSCPNGIVAVEYFDVFGR
jgi:hypothetical protein